MRAPALILRLAPVFILPALLCSTPALFGQAQPPNNLMPMPSEVAFTGGGLAIDSAFTVGFTGYTEPRLERAAERFVRRLAAQTGVPVGIPAFRSASPHFEIRCEGGTEKVQQAVEDESYRLEVGPRKAVLSAATPYGVLRGLETALQLVESGVPSFTMRGAVITDRPRFPWRGILIDVCRHFIPLDVLKRNIDAMAAAKMNVLHWHLSEDQGFRVESKKFPKLHEMGSDGLYFTQDEIREVVAYAADRGIRVVPEFDIPGHTLSWLVGYPELAAGEGPFALARKWGVFDPVMDPTKEEVYDFLEDFLGEMTGLFPDSYFHIGGDEVNGKAWDASASIAEFKREKGMKDNHDLQVYFNKRVLEILQDLDRTMVGWDEILHPDLPKDIVVHSWRGQKSLAGAVRQGSHGILSSGYYLDHMRSAAFHYQVDPLGGDVALLGAEEQRRVLGGEACMWAEYINGETIDARIWPRAAAIAERLWSPAGVRDTLDMERRLALFSARLEWLGLTHRSSYGRMLARMAEYRDIEGLKVLGDVAEHVKGYERGRLRPYTAFTPMNRMVDAIPAESITGREFGRMVDRYLRSPGKGALADSIVRQLQVWEGNHARLSPLFASAPMTAELRDISESLMRSAALGLEAMNVLQAPKKTLPKAAQEKRTQALAAAAKPQPDITLVVVPHIRRLVEAADKPR